MCFGLFAPKQPTSMTVPDTEAANRQALGEGVLASGKDLKTEKNLASITIGDKVKPSNKVSGKSTQKGVSALGASLNAGDVRPGGLNV